MTWIVRVGHQDHGSLTILPAFSHPCRAEQKFKGEALHALTSTNRGDSFFCGLSYRSGITYSRKMRTSWSGLAHRAVRKKIIAEFSDTGIIQQPTENRIATHHKHKQLRKARFKKSSESSHMIFYTTMEMHITTTYQRSISMDRPRHFCGLVVGRSCRTRRKPPVILQTIWGVGTGDRIHADTNVY